ncbi:DNA polymerase III subunit delta' [Planktothrix sp. FACHB-1355]|uniref:DNA polymerase III subunit delta' n=1 Tax=Planktothrix sp. FACHB-1355 TaxID=2692854 RepID=UPI00168B96CB|nr:DNA polymerase III subunit delta' [Planktothrix sp. FACHB-1355]MBD3557573.1 DNA polymerase III subunit delta' [Planktothrix sp. FACHB-1355]
MSILQFFPDPGDPTDTTGIPERATFEPFFDEIVGQSTAIKLLQKAIATNRVPNAFLFVGSDGVGKRLTAKCFIQACLCHPLPTETASKCALHIEAGTHPDVLWVEPTFLHSGKLIDASTAASLELTFKQPPVVRIEQVREIANFLAYPPLSASRQVVVIEGVNSIASTAANALLKTLEEPGNATLILIAANSESILPTIRSRCCVIPFRNLGQQEMCQVLERMGYSQILAYPEIIEMAQGCPGNAIAAWNYLMHIEQIVPGVPSILEFNQATSQLLQVAKTISQKLDFFPQLWLLDYWQFQLWKMKRDRRIIEVLENAKKSLRLAQSQLVFEVCLLKLAEIRTD